MSSRNNYKRYTSRCYSPGGYGIYIDSLQQQHVCLLLLWWYIERLPKWRAMTSISRGDFFPTERYTCTADEWWHQEHEWTLFPRGASANSRELSSPSRFFYSSLFTHESTRFLLCIFLQIHSGRNENFIGLTPYRQKVENSLFLSIGKTRLTRS